MDKSIGILDKDYSLWVDELVKRYRGSQIKAAIKVNKELLRYYWELGKDIEEKQADNKYGSKFYATLSRDLRHEMPDVEGLSETSIRYAKRFYTLYNQQVAILPQVVEESEKGKSSTTCGKIILRFVFNTLGASPLYHRQMFQ
ncbi:DUF1016 N-terminal domain-containing protein [Bacteroides ovatus]|nr:DUF1016 N-terminal domain-containing protein [Bacteroides ovatus]